MVSGADTLTGSESDRRAISPELVLVDPELARRLREIERASSEVRRVPELPTVVGADRIPPRARGPSTSTVPLPAAGDHARRTVPSTVDRGPVQLGDMAQPSHGLPLVSASEVEAPIGPFFDVDAAGLAAAETPAPADQLSKQEAGAPRAPAPQRSEVRRVIRAFVLGAVIAAVTVVGVIARMGEEAPVAPISPLVEAGPSPALRSTANGGRPVAGESVDVRTRHHPIPTGPTHFSWRPVSGAVAYRFVLHRGATPVLEARTARAGITVKRQWRVNGRRETLGRGVYHWYVWPVMRSGGSEAAVRSRLVIG